MLPNFVHTATFRFVLLHTVFFFISAIVLSFVIYFDTQQSLESQIRDRITAEVQQLMIDYHQDGMEELRHDIRERIEANSTNRLQYCIQNSNGRGIFDKIPPLLSHRGWIHHESLLLFAQPLHDGYLLIIGAELTSVRDIQQIILHAFGISVVIALFLAVFGGFFISRRFVKRVDKLRKTAELVGKGDLSQRIPINGTRDEFDQLANIINQMLNRIQVLVQELHHVTTNIAHDLRTPLTQLRNQLETIPNSENAISVLDQALGTFNSLLRIAEIESGRRQEDFQLIDLSSLVMDLVDAYKGVADEKEVHINCDVANSVKIVGDRHLMIQMISNLIENALKYGGNKIEVNLTKKIISIQDNGLGIPENEFVNITKPFYRLDKSRSSKGNGLGLSLVRAIAGLHGMSLTFENMQPGFAVTISMS